MEFAKCAAPAAVLLTACCLLLCLGYASSATESLVECPLIAPLSSYSPSIPAAVLSPVTPQVAAKLESKLSSLVANSSVPFYAVSVVHDDQTVFTSGLATSPFMIGSVTKTFIALGALILRERGLLSLDDPVKKFLPDFVIINPYEPHDITLRELMGHVSGMPRELCPGNICPANEADVLKFVAGMELVRPAWSREPSYSNLGFALLGHSWEKATSPSKTWEEFVREDILEQLGMNNSGVAFTNVSLVTNESSGNYEIGWEGPAGNMYSTAVDLAKYLIFLLKAKPALISAATIREWTHSRTIFPDATGGYALPWELLLINSTRKEFLITKNGATGNFESIIAIHPPTQLGVSVLLVLNENSSVGPDQLMEEVLNYLIPLVEEETAGIIAPLYTGHYVCKASPPAPSQPLNVTVGVLGGFIDIADSALFGLSASLNVSLLFDGQIVPQLWTAGLLLKNSTENSFWLGGGGPGCANAFGLISSIPSITDPNYPGTDFAYEIEFNFANKTLTWLSTGAICTK